MKRSSNSDRASAYVNLDTCINCICHSSDFHCFCNAAAGAKVWLVDLVCIMFDQVCIMIFAVYTFTSSLWDAGTFTYSFQNLKIHRCTSFFHKHDIIRFDDFAHFNSGNSISSCMIFYQDIHIWAYSIPDSFYTFFNQGSGFRMDRSL